MGIIPFAAKCMATVSLFVYSIISGSCYHYTGGIIPFKAKYIATVQPSVVFISGLWCHYFGGIIPL